MSGIEKIKIASAKAEEIVTSFTGHVAEDAVAIRAQELHAMKKDELLTLAMERGITDVAKEMKKEEIIELIKKFEV